MSKRRGPVRGPLRMVWSPKDFQETVGEAIDRSGLSDDLVRHAEEAMALLRPAAEDLREQPCPVIDLFTRERVR